MAAVSGHVCLTGPGIGGWLVLAGYYHLTACLHRTEDFRLFRRTLVPGATGPAAAGQPVLPAQTQKGQGHHGHRATSARVLPAAGTPGSRPACDRRPRRPTAAVLVTSGFACPEPARHHGHQRHNGDSRVPRPTVASYGNNVPNGGSLRGRAKTQVTLRDRLPVSLRPRLAELAAADRPRGHAQGLAPVPVAFDRP